MRDAMVFWHIPCRTAGEVSLDYHSLYCYGCRKKLDMREVPDEIAVHNIPYWWLKDPDVYDYFPSNE